MQRSCRRQGKRRESSGTPARGLFLRFDNTDDMSLMLLRLTFARPSKGGSTFNHIAITTTMKLAEALSLRADLQKRVNELKVRFKDSAKVQEGDTPAEDLAALDVELNTALEELEDLIYRINATNMRTVHEGETVTRLMARKDVLAMRVQLMKEVLSHVVEGDARYGRNEIKTVRVVDVPDLRRRTDAAARELRELDMKIQALNWSVDLIEEDTNK